MSITTSIISGLAAFWKTLGLILIHFTPEEKKKRLKLELKKLKKEKEELLCITPCTVPIAKKLTQIVRRMAEIETILEEG